MLEGCCTDVIEILAALLQDGSTHGLHETLVNILS